MSSAGASPGQDRDAVASSNVSQRTPCIGHVVIDGATEVMTVMLKDIEDRGLWSTRIEPRMQQWSRGSPSVRS
jgi:hypothetical protein